MYCTFAHTHTLSLSIYDIYTYIYTHYIYRYCSSSRLLASLPSLNQVSHTSMNSFVDKKDGNWMMPFPANRKLEGMLICTSCGTWNSPNSPKFAELRCCTESRSKEPATMTSMNLLTWRTRCQGIPGDSKADGKNMTGPIKLIQYIQ